MKNETIIDPRILDSCEFSTINYYTWRDNNKLTNMFSQLTDSVYHCLTIKQLSVYKLIYEEHKYNKASIGRMFGISKQAVSKLHKKIIRNLNRYVHSHKQEEFIFVYDVMTSELMNLIMEIQNKKDIEKVCYRKKGSCDNKMTARQIELTLN